MRGMELSWSQILDLATDELEQIMNELESEMASRLHELEKNNLTNVPAYILYGADTGMEFQQTTQADMARRENYLARISMARQFLTDTTSTVEGAKQWRKENEVDESIQIDYRAHAILSDFYAGEVYRDSDLWQAIEDAHKAVNSLQELLNLAAELFEAKYPQFTKHWVPQQGEFYEL